mgnify:CR=1 FL=1
MPALLTSVSIAAPLGHDAFDHLRDAGLVGDVDAVAERLRRRRSESIADGFVDRDAC